MKNLRGAPAPQMAVQSRHAPPPRLPTIYRQTFRIFWLKTRDGQFVRINLSTLRRHLKRFGIWGDKADDIIWELPEVSYAGKRVSRRGVELIVKRPCLIVQDTGEVISL